MPALAAVENLEQVDVHAVAGSGTLKPYAARSIQARWRARSRQLPKPPAPAMDWETKKARMAAMGITVIKEP